MRVFITRTLWGAGGNHYPYLCLYMSQRSMCSSKSGWNCIDITGNCPVMLMKRRDIRRRSKGMTQQITSNTTSIIPATTIPASFKYFSHPNFPNQSQKLCSILRLLRHKFPDPPPCVSLSRIYFVGPLMKLRVTVPLLVITLLQ